VKAEKNEKGDVLITWESPHGEMQDTPFSFQLEADADGEGD
jgi:hypothetical protein